MPLEGLQPTRRDRAVDGAVIDRQRDRHHGCHRQLAVFHNRPGLTRAHGQYRALRRVDHGGEFAYAVTAQIGNGERAAARCTGRQCSGARVG